MWKRKLLHMTCEYSWKPAAKCRKPQKRLTYAKLQGWRLTFPSAARTNQSKINSICNVMPTIWIKCSRRRVCRYQIPFRAYALFFNGKCLVLEICLAAWLLAIKTVQTLQNNLTHQKMFLTSYVVAVAIKTDLHIIHTHTHMCLYIHTHQPDNDSYGSKTEIRKERLRR